MTLIDLISMETIFEGMMMLKCFILQYTHHISLCFFKILCCFPSKYIASTNPIPNLEEIEDYV